MDPIYRKTLWNGYGGGVFARVGLDFLMCCLQKKEMHTMISRLILELYLKL